MPLAPEQIDGLRSNLLDSVHHAMDHFWERARSEGYLAKGEMPSIQHEKWIILSVHHAADCLLKLLCNKLGMLHLRQNRSGEVHYPSASEMLRRLGPLADTGRLSVSEKKLLVLLALFDKKRHELMHGPLPEAPNVSVAAFAMLAIIRVIRTQYGIPSNYSDWESPELLSDVLETIPSKSLSEYSDYVEQALIEEQPNTFFDPCLYCGAAALATKASFCEACLVRIDWIECDSCLEQIPIVADDWPDNHQSCPVCGLEIPR